MKDLSTLFRDRAPGNDPPETGTPETAQESAPTKSLSDIREALSLRADAFRALEEKAQP